ncbi:MAG: queuosine precursor transporter [Porphyrobacter sp.]|nr:queuosine precursor transporter [Porphyrobacter sp.]
MENAPSAADKTADPAAAFDLDPTDGIIATSRAPVAFRHYDLVMAAFVAILLLSNIIGAAKLTFVDVPFWPQGLFLALMSWVVTALPPFAGWECAASGFGGERPISSNADPAIPGGAICQSTYESVFGSTWRIVVASITAFWAGEFVNSFVMAKMKVWTKGRALWTRTIGSTFVGQGVDSLIFYPVAFYGIWTTDAVLTVMVTNWALKVAWEALLTPVTYVVVGKLKAAEGVDLFDMDTDFSPFASDTAKA